MRLNSQTLPQTQKAPLPLQWQRGFKVTPRAGRRRPALPPAKPAVPSALGGLTSGFGMGPGVPPLLWPPTGSKRLRGSIVSACLEGRTASLSHGVGEHLTFACMG